MIKRYYKAFSKNDKGEDIFYPWRYPGEALVLTGDIKKKFVLIYNALFYGSFISFAFIADLESRGVIGSAELQCLFAVIVSIYHLFYIAFISSYSRKCKLYVLEKGLRPRKYLILTWFFALLQVLALYLIVTEWSLSDFVSVLFFFLLAVCTIFTIFIFCLTIKTRGYLLEEGTFQVPNDTLCSK